MSKDNYLTLEKNLIHLFQHINKSKEIYIRKPDQRLGLHIIFKHQDIRSSIRIYPTNKDNLFIYAVGNTQKYLGKDDVLQHFYDDYKKIKINFDQNLYSRPIDELIKLQQEGVRQKEFQETLLSQELHFNNKKEEYFDLLELDTVDFASKIKELTKKTLKEQLEEERQKKTLQDARITTMIKSFTNYIKVHFKKDAIATSLKGKHEITYSFQDINFSTTILKDYDLDQFNSLLHHSNYQDFLNQTFTGFNIENKIISNSMKLIEDLKLKISWNN